MQALLAPLKELAEYQETKDALKKGEGVIALTGCVDSQKLHMIYGLSDGLKHKVIVTYSDMKAKEICEEYKFYDRNTLLYPAKDPLRKRAVRRRHSEKTRKDPAQIRPGLWISLGITGKKQRTEPLRQLSVASLRILRFPSWKQYLTQERRRQKR